MNTYIFFRVEGQSYNDTVDQWCLGILCYEFLVGRPPFESPDSENTYAKIRRLEIDYPSYLSIGAKDLIAGVCLNFYKLFFSYYKRIDKKYQFFFV